MSRRTIRWFTSKAKKSPALTAAAFLFAPAYLLGGVIAKQAKASKKRWNPPRKRGRFGN